MTFTEILESEHYHLVEAIEHGSSDPAIMQKCIDDLYNATGYQWVS